MAAGSATDTGNGGRLFAEYLAEKRPATGENLRAILTRPSFTGTEIQVLRGIVSCLDRFTRESPRGATNPNRTRNRRPKVPRDDD